MNTYTCTITCEVDADDADWAIVMFGEWLTDPRNVEEGTVVTTATNPTNPDHVWHTLTLAAKRSWVQAMMPDPRLTAGQEALVRANEARLRAAFPHVYLDPDDGGDPYRSVFSNPQQPTDYIPACPECGEPDLPLHKEHE